MNQFAFRRGLDHAPFFTDLILFHHVSEGIGQMKNIDHYRVRNFGHIYRFIDALFAMNDSKEFGDSFKEISPEN